VAKASELHTPKWTMYPNGTKSLASFSGADPPPCENHPT